MSARFLGVPQVVVLDSQHCYAGAVAVERVTERRVYTSDGRVWDADGFWYADRQSWPYPRIVPPHEGHGEVRTGAKWVYGPRGPYTADEILAITLRLREAVTALGTPDAPGTWAARQQERDDAAFALSLVPAGDLVASLETVRIDRRFA